MNTKALAAMVGTLSLSALAAGCASTQAAQKPVATMEKEGGSGSCGAAGCSASKEKSDTPATGASATPEKGASGSCGKASCSGAK